MIEKSNNLFLASIKGIHQELDVKWPGGRMQTSDDLRDHHWTLKGHFRPVSVSTVEAVFLFNLALRLKVSSAIEIGTGFGYSTFWIGEAIRSNTNASGHLVTVDNRSEGDAPNIGAEFAQKGAVCLGLQHIISFSAGTSPRALEHIESNTCDFGFIDGNHREDHPTQDFRAIERCLTTDGVVVWHDVYRPYSVMRAIKYSESIGFYTIFLSTSCRMAVSCRNITRLADAKFALKDARTFQSSDGIRINNMF